MQNYSLDDNKNTLYSYEDSTQDAQEHQDTPEGGGISWTASEFIVREKKSSWYLLLIMVTVIIASLMFLLTREIISAVAVIMLALLFGIYGNAKPRSLQYGVDEKGITVDKKHYTYETFRGAEMIKDGTIPEISFIPTRRIAVPLTIYYPIEREQEILHLVGTFLPVDIKRSASIDRLAARLRF